MLCSCLAKVFRFCAKYLRITTVNTTSFTCFVLIVSLAPASGQVLATNTTDGLGVCTSIACYNTLHSLKQLQNCVVVLGDLRIFLIHKTKIGDFQNLSFPNLREVTGFMVVYRVLGLETLGQLFPNLARIRGTNLIDNFGLIVHDMPHLREVGLYNLLKIDRGGVIIWGGPHTCYVLTVDWKTIAPRSRHVLTPPDKDSHCVTTCSCTANVSTNHCWNNIKCQRYLEGPDGLNCHDQCLGCRMTKPNECTVCRHYTHRGKCVPRCPTNTFVQPDSKYCLTMEECISNANGSLYNNTCVLKCPIEYVRNNNTGVATCLRCINCQKTCKSQNIRTLNTIQQAEPCVYINGSLTIHVRAIPGAMEELRRYLSRIQEVRDYVLIYGSISITSLDFLSSLKRINGTKLKNKTDSLIIHDMMNLQELFSPNVTKSLEIGNGKLKMYGNPMLCTNKINEIKSLFPKPSNETDIPTGMNGYSGGCAEASVNLKISVVNDTTATVIFSPFGDPNITYTILYVRIPPGNHATFVPETCSVSEWFAVHVPLNYGRVDLTSLRPASTYAVCIETYSYSYDPPDKPKVHLARSTIVKFTTKVGKPEPPFVYELVASSFDVIVLRWVNHKNYRPYITHYELDVILIEIQNKDLIARDHCDKRNEILEETDYSRHAVVLKPPPEYDRGCQSMCGILSTVTKGAMEEDHFDVCESLDSDCNEHEEERPGNTNFESYVRTLSVTVDINRRENVFQVGGLAPYRDYKFRFRACVNGVCSRSSRGVVRTLRSNTADIPLIVYYDVDASGHIFVKWDPPETTNGPVLAYSLQVLPILKGEIGRILAQSWCVLPDVLSLRVRSQIASKYLVRVCSSTLGSVSVCSKWESVYTNTNLSQWLGVLFGVSLILIPTMIVYFWNRRRAASDVMPLVDSTVISSVESEPPSATGDFVPYTVPLRDTMLDY